MVENIKQVGGGANKCDQQKIYKSLVATENALYMA